MSLRTNKRGKGPLVQPTEELGGREVPSVTAPHCKLQTLRRNRHPQVAVPDSRGGCWPHRPKYALDHVHAGRPFSGVRDGCSDHDVRPPPISYQPETPCDISEWNSCQDFQECGVRAVGKDHDRTPSTDTHTMLAFQLSSINRRQIWRTSLGLAFGL